MIYHSVTCPHCGAENVYRGPPRPKILCFLCLRQVAATPATPVTGPYYREWCERKEYLRSGLLSEIVPALPPDAVELRAKLLLYKGLL